MDDDHGSAVPALLELLGAGLVVAGFVLAWLPLGLIACGALLALAAVALERAEAPRPGGRDARGAGDPGSRVG